MKNIWKRILSAAVAVTAACSMFAAPVSAAWVQTGSRWWYQNADGTYPHSGWSQISGKWYLFDSAGYMLTGWQQVNGVWYYLNPAGDMATGWKQVGNAWYYLDGSGAMKTGWLDLNGSKYYLNSAGVMLTGTQTIDGKTYTFSASGALTGSSAGTGSGSNSGNTTAPAGETQVVYWGKTGAKYHIDPNCRSFKGTAANSGALEQAKAAGREDWCGICSKGWTDERLLKNGNPNAK